MSIKNERPNKGKGGRIAVHSESFKVQVAREYLDGAYSQPQIAEKYNLACSTVEYFVSWYKKHHIVEIMAEEFLSHQANTPSTLDQKDLEKRLMLAEMKIAALEKVIALANEEYGTDLKKKTATK
jgi:transposase-like protein